MNEKFINTNNKQSNVKTDKNTDKENTSKPKGPKTVDDITSKMGSNEVGVETKKVEPEVVEAVAEVKAETKTPEEVRPVGVNDKSDNKSKQEPKDNTTEKPKLRKLTDLVIKRYEEEVNKGNYNGPHKVSLLSTIKTIINRPDFNPEDIKPFVEKFVNKEGNAFADLVIYRGISEDYAALLSYIDLTISGVEAVVPKGINAFNIEKLKER